MQKASPDSYEIGEASLSGKRVSCALEKSKYGSSRAFDKTNDYEFTINSDQKELVGLTGPWEI